MKYNKERKEKPINYRNLTASQKLDAVAWASRCAGVTYGKYLATVSEEEIEAAYCCFARKLEVRRLEEVQRRRIEAKRNEA